MKRYAPDNVSHADITDELLDGAGTVLIRGLFTPDEIALARDIVMRQSEQKVQ